MEPYCPLCKTSIHRSNPQRDDDTLKCYYEDCISFIGVLRKYEQLYSVTEIAKQRELSGVSSD